MTNGTILLVHPEANLKQKATFHKRTCSHLSGIDLELSVALLLKSNEILRVLKFESQEKGE